MKYDIYLAVHGLEALAKHGPAEVSCYSFTIVPAGSEHAPLSQFRVVESLEIPLPSQAAAAVIARELLLAESAIAAKTYRERISKLEALTWEPQA